MNKLSIFTTMTNPEDRKDPWKEALNCTFLKLRLIFFLGKGFQSDCTLVVYF